jgi:TonB-dependent SusC/RagA subfamily outer membrane receptor
MIFSLIIISACMATRYSATNSDASRVKTSKTNAISEINTPYARLTLLDYLKRIPGIQMVNTGAGPEIRVRNGVSFLGEQGPLYVINNVRIGNRYATAEAFVDTNDIQSIQVLKDVSSTNAYGIQGANGVIIIQTKE